MLEEFPAVCPPAGAPAPAARAPGPSSASRPGAERLSLLAFDLFVGTWETEDALGRGVSRFLLVPRLALTFMFGPAGLLMYFLVRQTRKGRSDRPTA